MKYTFVTKNFIFIVVKGICPNTYNYSMEPFLRIKDARTSGKKDEICFSLVPGQLFRVEGVNVIFVILITISLTHFCP